MLAGASRVDITPDGPVWMEGMIRDHKSEGIHDRLFARCVVLSNDPDAREAVAIVSLDVCMIGSETALRAKDAIRKLSGILPQRVILAATHTHSGPATIGLFQPAEQEYLSELELRIADVVADAVSKLRSALISVGSASEHTISHYRRFANEQGKVVMYWEQDPALGHLKPLGEPDPEVGAVDVVDAQTGNRIGLVFNHAGHPNVMSGENYMISGDYAGAAARIVEDRLGGVGIFLNGAQGSVDIDNWRHRGWEDVQTLGARLAAAVQYAAETASPTEDDTLRFASVRYKLPRRRISDEELVWAAEVLATTGGSVTALADGVGDDYKAVLYGRLRECQDEEIDVEQTAFSVGDTALVSFPGELFTEIGLGIRAASPFKRTYIVGLANGCIGYVPTRRAIAQGGYEVDTRQLDDSAAEVIEEMSLALLRELSGGK